MTITYRITESPIGRLLLAASDDGILRIAFAREDHDAVLARLAAGTGEELVEGTTDVLDAAVDQLHEYLDGRRRDFDLPLDLRLVAGFRRTVLDRLVAVPYGTTVTYAQLAAAANNAAAVRAVGTACATNPLPVVVPCHRVVRTDGGRGEYLGGVEVKQRLLALEAA
jgi:methylated-DNA-[protein]-cysteine S-methyltransferase